MCMSGEMTSFACVFFIVLDSDKGLKEKGRRDDALFLFAYMPEITLYNAKNNTKNNRKSISL